MKKLIQFLKDLKYGYKLVLHEKERQRRELLISFERLYKRDLDYLLENEMYNEAEGCRNHYESLINKHSRQIIELPEDTETITIENLLK
ncbi:hypothetical protein R5O24_02860 [Tenacibaculum maritimum]|uniref:hypothetical protein n=1 Tax=Tenacibaculum maritimum TaxID=107401 RepID=UPI00388F6361